MNEDCIFRRSCSTSVLYLGRNDADGLALRNGFAEYFRTCSRRMITYEESPTREHYLHGALHHTICIVDITPAAVGPLHEVLTRMAYPSVLLVSRKYLPTRLTEGMRRSISPKFPGTYTNKHILREFINSHEAHMGNAPFTPATRPSLGPRLRSRIKEAQAGIQVVRGFSGHSCDVAVSYRSHLWPEVRRLVEESSLNIHAYAPGEITFEDEATTLWQRWQITELFVRHMVEAQEVWIFLSDDYLHSWWTQAELITLRAFIGRKKYEQKVKVLNSVTERTQPVTDALIPHLSRREAREIRSLVEEAGVYGETSLAVYEWMEQNRSGTLRSPRFVQSLLGMNSDSALDPRLRFRDRYVDIQPQVIKSAADSRFDPAIILDPGRLGVLRVSDEEMAQSRVSGSFRSAAGLFAVREEPPRSYFFPGSGDDPSKTIETPTLRFASMS